jgi:predicted ArsR family transcriptional regulator
MNGEHAFNAAKSMASEFAAYVMAVAEKYGKQEALDLLFITFDQYGRRVGDMLKQQLGDKEASVHNIYDIVVPMFVAQGFEPEKIEESANDVIVKIPRCPLYEGCREVGAIAEEFCRCMARPLMDGIVEAINPKARHKFLKYRTSAEDHCIEQIVTDT